MDLEKWVDDIFQRFPTSTTPQKDEWYGVENGVDVLEIAIAVKQLQAELDEHKQQGGISMKCGHPVQCLYSQCKLDGGPKCSMCELQAELENMTYEKNRWFEEAKSLCDESVLIHAELAEKQLLINAGIAENKRLKAELDEWINLGNRSLIRKNK